MSFIICKAEECDLPAITEIYNQAVRETTAIWNDREVDVADRRQWWQARLESGLPVMVARDGRGQCLGYATFGPWRPHDGFAHTVEHSVYVAPRAAGQGLGRLLMTSLMASANEQGVHVMVAAIEADNQPSIALHRRLGFTETGRLPQVGLKFGRWLDLVFMQYTF
ncbi:GNAT family N-acetyltransferase [Larsenimonas salina]|uniref:GNAT family N-acetyltransferase n=1 Tax=Larsenimonas salina TaxID=1295565 RepID=UPI0032EB2E14